MIGLGLFLGGMLFKTIVAVTLVAMAIAGPAYFAVKITVNIFRKYKKKKESKLVMANIRQHRTKTAWRLCTESACDFSVILHKNT